jgi:hypothetical protein
MPAEMIDNPNRLAERVVGTGDGLTLEQMLERADEIADRTVCQWHAGAGQEVMFMIGHWASRGMSGIDLAMTAMCFAAAAHDMKENAEQLGYPDIAAAAGDLMSALLRIDTDVEGGDDGSLRGQGETVTTALAHLRTKIVEARRAWADGTDLLAAA